MGVGKGRRKTVRFETHPPGGWSTGSWLMLFLFGVAVGMLVTYGPCMPPQILDRGASGHMEVAGGVHYHVLQYFAEAGKKPLGRRGRPVRLVVVGGEVSTLVDEMREISALVSGSSKFMSHGLEVDAFLALRIPEGIAQTRGLHRCMNDSVSRYNASVILASATVCNATTLAVDRIANATLGAPVVVRVHDPRFSGDPCIPDVARIPGLRAAGRGLLDYYQIQDESRVAWDPVADFPVHVKAWLAHRGRERAFADVVVFRDTRAALGGSRFGRDEDDRNALPETLELMGELLRDYDSKLPPPMGGIAEVVGGAGGSVGEIQSARRIATFGAACGVGLVSKPPAAAQPRGGNDTVVLLRMCGPMAGADTARMKGLCEAARLLFSGKADMRMVAFRKDSMTATLRACQDELLGSFASGHDEL